MAVDLGRLPGELRKAKEMDVGLFQSPLFDLSGCLVAYHVPRVGVLFGGFVIQETKKLDMCLRVCFSDAPPDSPPYLSPRPCIAW